MKKSILITGLVLFSFILSAGTSGEDIYNQLKAKHTETFSMSLSKNMIDFFDMDLDFDGKEKLITGDFHEGRLLVLKGVNSIKDVNRLFEKGKYKQIESEDTSDGDTDAYLYISKKGKNIDEAHFVIANDDGKVTVLSVFGNIQVTNK